MYCRRELEKDINNKFSNPKTNNICKIMNYIRREYGNIVARNIIVTYNPKKNLCSPYKVYSTSQCCFIM